jgi:hypothetical protein
MEPAGMSGTSERPRTPLAIRGLVAAAIVLGTAAGVFGTSWLAVVFGATRVLSTGLQPRPMNAMLRWLFSAEVSEPATTALLWLLGATTVLLAAFVVTAASRRRVRRSYLAWAIVGGVLTTYALVANWQLAREAGLLALVVGGVWSVVVGVMVWRV